MAKKRKNVKVNNNKIESGNEMGKFILMIVIVSLLFIAFYGITILITNKKDTNQNTTVTPPTITYDTILLGNLLSQTDEKYYTLIFDQEDDNVMLYEAYLSVYEKLDKHDAVYYSILNHPLNARFQGDTTVTKVTNVLDLRFKGTTLVYVEKGKITKTYDNEESILKVLKEISKVKEDTKE